MDSVSRELPNHDKMPDFVETPSGHFVSITNPSRHDIKLEDVAHKLALTNRWGGSTRYPYSVAQHAVYVSRRLQQTHPREPRLWLLGLHHDDPEAFLGDIPRPWKRLIGDVYEGLTATWEIAIEAALSLPKMQGGDYTLIKEADVHALLVEGRHLLPSQAKRWGYLTGRRVVTPDYFYTDEISWRVARQDYLERHLDLTHGNL